MSGERGSFRVNALHDAPIACDAIDFPCKQRSILSIEFCSEELHAERHPYRIADSLAQRSSGRFNAIGQAIFGMSGSLGMELPEPLDLVHRQLVAGQMEAGIEPHGAMACRQDHSIPV